MRGEKSMQKEDAAMAVEKKETAKAEDTKTIKTTPVKAEVKETEVKTKEPVKAKEPAKKVGRPPKKAAAKAELKPEIFVQFQGKESVLEDALDRAKGEYTAAGHRVSSIKSLQLYLKPEEGAAYYVINQKFAGKVELF